MKKLFRTFLLIKLAPLLFAANVATAESFIDVYGGSHSTEDSEVTVQRQAFLDYPQSHSKSLEFEDGVVIGGRYGLWLEHTSWLGFAGDVSYFVNESEDSEISVLPLSLLLMVRFPLMSSGAFPKGRIQPYIAGGPSLVVSQLDIDLSSEGGGKVKETTSDLGLDLRAGLALQATESLAIFSEYRYVHANLNYDSDEEYIVPRLDYLEINTDLDSHHFLVGLSYRY